MTLGPILRILDVLYVEDDRQVSKLIARDLSYAAQVHVVETLVDAIATLGVRLYDAVLLDLSLPDSNGLDTIRNLRREMRRANRDIPIIVLTGSGDPDDEQAQEAIDVGAAWWLEKGVSGTKIVRTIRLEMVKATLRKLKNRNLGTGE